MNSADFPAEAFRHQQSTADARVQIGRWIPSNTTIDDALTAHGFTCAKQLPLSAEIRTTADCWYSTTFPHQSNAYLCNIDPNGARPGDKKQYHPAKSRTQR